MIKFVMCKVTEQILCLKFVGILKFVKIRKFQEFLKFIKFKFSIYDYMQGAKGARPPGLPPTGGLPPNPSYFFVRDMCVCLAFLTFRLLQSPT